MLEWLWFEKIKKGKNIPVDDIIYFESTHYTDNPRTWQPR